MFPTKHFLTVLFAITLVAIIWVLPLSAAHVRADAPTREDVAAARLAQEPALACVAFETGLSAEMVALAKVQFDTEFGVAHGIVTDAQWNATFGDRMQFFADALGVPNPTRNGSSLPWCARLIEARKKILAAWSNP